MQIILKAGLPLMNTHGRSLRQGTTWTALTSADATDGDDLYTITSAESANNCVGW